MRSVRAKDLYLAKRFRRLLTVNDESLLLKGPTEQLSDEDLQLLNRQLLQIAFLADLRTPRNEQLWIGYAGFRNVVTPYFASKLCKFCGDVRSRFDY